MRKTFSLLPPRPAGRKGLTKQQSALWHRTRTIHEWFYLAVLSVLYSTHMVHRIILGAVTQAAKGDDPEADISLNTSSCCCSLGRRLLTEQCKLPRVPRGLGGTKA